MPLAACNADLVRVENTTSLIEHEHLFNACTLLHANLFLMLSSMAPKRIQKFGWRHSPPHLSTTTGRADAAAGMKPVSQELDLAMSRIALRSTNKRMLASSSSSAVTKPAKAEMESPMAQMCMTFMQTRMGMGMAGAGASSSQGVNLNNFQVFANRQKKLPDLPAEGSPPSQAGSPAATVPALKGCSRSSPSKEFV